MSNCREWFYLCLALIGAFTILFTMLLGYNLKWRQQQLELSKRTEALEKKNGKELAEIEKLKKRLAELEKGGQHD